MIVKIDVLPLQGDSLALAKAQEHGEGHEQIETGALGVIQELPDLLLGGDGDLLFLLLR